MEKQQSKKPLVRFPEFKDAWEHKRLNELLSEAKKRNEDLKYGKDEVLSVSGELGIVNQIEHLGRSYAGVSVHQYHVVEVGDIVYTKSPLKANPFGIIKLNKGKAGIVSTLYAVYKVNHQTAYGPFIDYYFSLDANTNRYLRPLVKKGAKNDMKINNAYVLHDRIFAPAIPEQKRIASFFTVLDKKITELKQKQSLLAKYKKGVMQKMFSQELRFKDANGMEFPTWEKKKLGDVALFLDEKRVPISEIERQTKKGIYPYYGASGIIDYVDNYLFDGEYILLGEDGANILNRTTELAFIVLGKFWVNNHAHILQAKGNNRFLAESLERINYEPYNTGTVQPKLNASVCKSIPIEMPCIEEQNKIAILLKTIDDKIIRTENQLKQTIQYKKGLLQNMFI